MDPAEEARFLILAAQREGNRQLAQGLRPLGVTPAQAEVLRLLAERQPLSMSGLGTLLVCESGANPSRLVDRLVTAGLVRREESSRDRRHVAAQIVSGIGFIGGGLIFVRRDAVRGLTTAATIWLTCAVGMACGGGLPILACAVTALHFVVVRGYPLLTERLIPGSSASVFELRMTYRTGTALLPQLMETCTRRGFRILQVKVDRLPGRTDSAARVLLELEGTGDSAPLTAELFENEGVIDVETTAAMDE
jgi:uncharacterized membrane protein YhiD involved in acid resistance